MSKRTDISSVLIIGAGPIVIGQACEFDYSGTQAVKAIREEGYRTILVNSNPATIMTDPELADRTYIEPLTVDTLERIIATEKPDAILPTVGGQTALNLAVKLAESGILKKYGVQLIGANLEAIKKAEDRALFKQTMADLGLDVPKSMLVHTMTEAIEVLHELPLPLIIRPAFTLGGTGGGIATTPKDYSLMMERAIASSPVSQVLVEESVVGWKEFELEVMRDKKDHVVIICSIENIDAMGVHTGDSITVAPAQTMTDKEYQRMRDAAIAIIRAIGVETGGSNVQFALNPANGRMIVIEMNPRVSRSSALASKATGFPIAKIAAKLAIGYTLDELPNDITKKTMAAFEPTIDYVVTKIPRFNFEKFPHTDPTLTTQMKSVGEVMAIGSTFQESFAKALSSLEMTPPDFSKASTELLLEQIAVPTADRVWKIMELLKRNVSLETLHTQTHWDMWFLHQLSVMPASEPASRNLDLRLRGDDTKPTFHLVDTCAAEFESTTPYLYSSSPPLNIRGGRGELDAPELEVTSRKKVIVLGSGPNRIGQGVEFDYCCCHASFALRDSGVESIMINCNPETVSTDYDTSDRLYFEPLTFDSVMAIIRHEKPHGVILQFGGQTPLKLARKLQEAKVPILGTSPESIHLAEDREAFSDLVTQLGLRQTEGRIARSLDEAKACASTLGFPLMVRPSYVLGGRGMEIIYDAISLERYITSAFNADPHNTILLDRFLKQAIEVDVDALCDGTDAWVAGIMEHVEEAGIHSGDSSCCLPTFSLPPEIVEQIRTQTIQLARALKVVGLLNVQFAVQDGLVYILEANPRASRTVPYVSKSIGVPLAKWATRIMLGEKLPVILNAAKDLKSNGHYSVKSPVFPFNKFPGVDTLLGPEMKSTGEVMGIGRTFGEAFAKAQEAAGNRLPQQGTVLITVRDADKTAIVPLAKTLHDLGFEVTATLGTRDFLHQHGIPAKRVLKAREGASHTPSPSRGEGRGEGGTEGPAAIVDLLKRDQIHLIINTTDSRPTVADSYIIRRTALEQGVPCLTTISAARAAVDGIRHIKTQTPNEYCLQAHQSST
jgi:carbamoyl-phosphate synthase large subunit